jgi:hypothetical protein
MFKEFIDKWLKKTEQEKIDSVAKEENGIVAITFYVDKDTVPFVDIVLEEYDENTLNSLCKLLDVLNGENCYLQVIDIIKNAMLKDGEEEKLIRILSHISQQKQSKLERYAKDKLKDEPCIKPSDMIK